MNSRPTVLCPIDFSDASRGALRYGRTIAQHVGGRLVILAVEDPLLTEAAALGTGTIWNPNDTRNELARFASRTLDGNPMKETDVEYTVAVGRPAQQILQAAQDSACDLIVMSTHGLTGMRKKFFGATTERVLRETTVPVLTIPPGDGGPHAFEDVRRSVGRILVPVDRSGASLDQVHVARVISEALDVRFLATAVVEPVRSPLAAKLHLPSIELERRTRADDELAGLLATVPGRPEALVVYGDPAEEIAKVARDRRVGLIVIGLHASTTPGTHLGSVTYRVLCLAPVLVLALPPFPDAAAGIRTARGVMWSRGPQSSTITS